VIKKSALSAKSARDFKKNLAPLRKPLRPLRLKTKNAMKPNSSTAFSSQKINN